MVEVHKLKIAMKLRHSSGVKQEYEILALTPGGLPVVGWKDGLGVKKEALLSVNQLTDYTIVKTEKTGWINISDLNGIKQSSRIYKSLSDAVANRITDTSLIYLDTIQISWKE